MAKYCCPHCHKNERISEYVSQELIYTGKFDDVGVIEANESENGDMYTTHYFCMSCQQVFNEPELVKEE